MGFARHDVVCPAASRGWGPSSGAMAVLKRVDPKRDNLKSAEEIMEMLEAFDLTGSLRDAAELRGARITRSGGMCGPGCGRGE